MTPTRLLAFATLFVAVMASVSCASTSQQQPSPTACDGVTPDAGGCSTERHTFTGTTCDELAREWATFIDSRVSEILTGPAGVAGQARSVRLKQAVGIASIDMNERMRSLSLRSTCDVDGVLTVAEPLSSPALKATVGSAVFDGDPVVGYNDWIVDVRRSLQVIDDGD